MLKQAQNDRFKPTYRLYMIFYRKIEKKTTPFSDEFCAVIINSCQNLLPLPYCSNQHVFWNRDASQRVSKLEPDLTEYFLENHK